MFVPQILSMEVNTNTLSFNSSYTGNIWKKVFKSGPSKICGRQPLKNCVEQTTPLQIF